MAMNGDALGKAIASAIMHPAAPPEAREQVEKMWQKIGGAIIAHLQANAEVTINVPITGASPSGPVTGTASGKGGLL